MPCNGQGNRIKIQTYYECRRHDTLHSQGEMRAKPDMKPWVHTDKNRMSSAGAALTVRALGLGKCRPFGAHCPTAPINPTNTIQTQSNTKTQTQQFTYTPKNILRTQYHDTTPQTPNPTKSPERATLLQSPG